MNAVTPNHIYQIFFLRCCITLGLFLVPEIKEKLRFALEVLSCLTFAWLWRMMKKRWERMLPLPLH